MGVNPYKTFTGLGIPDSPGLKKTLPQAACSGFQQNDGSGGMSKKELSLRALPFWTSTFFVALCF